MNTEIRCEISDVTDTSGTIEVDWGDGSAPQSFSATFDGSTTFSTTHDFKNATPGSVVTMSVTAKDAGNNSDTKQLQMLVPDTQVSWSGSTMVVDMANKADLQYPVGMFAWLYRTGDPNWVSQLATTIHSASELPYTFDWGTVITETGDYYNVVETSRGGSVTGPTTYIASNNPVINNLRWGPAMSINNLRWENAA